MCLEWLANWDVMKVQSADRVKFLFLMGTLREEILAERKFGGFGGSNQNPQN